MRKQIRWSVDQAHTEINFGVKHLMIANVNGSFRTFDGSIYTTGRDFTTAEIDFWIDPASVETGCPERNQHLKSVDFFNVEKYKEISFTSGTISKTHKEGVHNLWGTLTMMGVTKNIQLKVEFGGVVRDFWTNEKAGFTITGKIRRSDWGLVWNKAIETGGVMLSDEISITCEVELANIGFSELKFVLTDDQTAIFEMM